MPLSPAAMHAHHPLQAPSPATPGVVQARRHCLRAGAAWLVGAGLPAVAQPPPLGTANAPVTQAWFVSDEWTDCTRSDGTGLYFDVIRAAYARQGVVTEFRLMPYARTVQRVKDKAADGWLASYMHEQAFALYPRYHFDTTPQFIVYLKAHHPGAVTLESLRLRRVGWLRGYGLDKYIAQPMHITEFDKVDSAIQMLEMQRLDFVVMAQAYLDDHAREHGTDLSRFGTVHAVDLHLYLAFADTARGAQLRQLWDTSMETFHRTEACKALYRQYGFPYPFRQPVA